MDQPKLQRLLRLMMLLTANNTYTVLGLAKRLDTTTRTIYRYIDTFRDSGFVIKKNGNVYKIDKSSPYFKDISSLVHFTEEEAYILKSAIESIDENNLIKQNLKKKLYTIYNYKVLAETVVKSKNINNVNRIIEAIEGEKMVELNNYSSAHSHNITNRTVEPFAFTTNYVQVWAYEPKSGKNKLFKLSRIAEVNLLEKKWKNKQKHNAGFIDIFRISSNSQTRVKLKLSLRAATLLMEEYPLSEKKLIKITDNNWVLDAQVCSYEGIGRFVMGLLSEIEIIDTPELLEFVKKRIKLFKK